MERAARLAHDDTPQARLDKLDAVLAPTATSIEDAALFADMLSLPNDGRYPALDLTPQQRRQKTLEALILQLEILTRSGPVLTMFEDVHWIDPTSLEALNWTVDRIKTLPALLIVTFRPEFNAPWLGQSCVTNLTLNRLGEREAVAARQPVLMVFEDVHWSDPTTRESLDLLIDRALPAKPLPRAPVRALEARRRDSVPKPLRRGGESLAR